MTASLEGWLTKAKEAPFSHEVRLALLDTNPVDLPDDVVCNIAVFVDDSTLYCKCDQTSDVWQQRELASELESDL